MKMLVLCRSNMSRSGKRRIAGDAAVFPDGVSVLHWRGSAVTEIYPAENAMRAAFERSRSLFHFEDAELNSQKSVAVADIVTPEPEANDHA